MPKKQLDLGGGKTETRQHWVTQGLRAVHTAPSKATCIAITLSVSAAAIILNAVFWQHLQGALLFLPLTAVFITALHGGIPCGVLSTALLSLYMAYSYFEPLHYLAITDIQDRVKLIVFAIASMSGTFYAAYIRHSYFKSESARREYLEFVNSLSHSIVWELNLKNSKHTFVSQMTEEILKFPIEAWYHEKRFFFNRIYPDDQPIAKNTLERVVRGEMKNTGFEHRLVSSDGTVRWYHTEVHLNQIDSVRTLRGITVDIDKLKQIQEHELATQKTLQKSQRKLKFLLDVTSSMAADQIQYTNMFDRLAKLFVPEMADWCILDLLQGDKILREIGLGISSSNKNETEKFQKEFTLAQDAPQGVERVILSGLPELYPEVTDTSWLGETIGTEHPENLRTIGAVSFMIVPLIARGKTLGALTFVSTLSKRRFNQEDFDLAKEAAYRAAIIMDNAQLYSSAQKAIMTRDNLLAVVSHDLKNPLSTVLMSADLQLRQLPPENTSMRRLAQSIRNSAEGMRTLIRDLLDLNKMEAGKFTVEAAETDVSKLIDEVIDMFKMLASQHSIHLVRGGFPQEQIIECDRNRLLQVFSNLVGNALKFTPAGGTITIEAESIDNQTVFSVADTGSGIPAEDIPYIFDRYWQAQKHADKGIGLGLSIVKGIIAAHGGKVWVTSQPGAGTRFCFTLPVKSDVIQPSAA